MDSAIFRMRRAGCALWYRKSMGSRIEENLMRSKQDAEERAARRIREGAPASALSHGLEIRPAREAELASSVSSLIAAHEALTSFDFGRGSLASFLELVFSAASAIGASDVHFEPEEGSVRLRFRLDGLLYDAARIPSDFYRLFASRVKILGGMKLNAERPQDGRFTVRFPGKNVEIRLSSAPAQHGETFVARLLDPSAVAIDLPGLGLRPDDLSLLLSEIAMPNGMILNTGPTGSGKTTTLYALLRERSRPEEKVVTVEDPIEYALPGIEQTQVNPEAGYSFATGLRAIVRQDPDVILIGEIRDGETAAIAIQAALTGHLVFSTVHANDAPGAIPRLLDFEVKASSVGPALNCVMGQRLVRRLCDACKRPAKTDAAALAAVGKYLEGLPARVDRAEVRDISLWEPAGCDSCNHIGYRGRIGIFEIMRVDHDTGNFIEKGASPTETRDFAIARGMVTMQQDGILKALHGITTLDEVLSATGPLPFPAGG